MYEQFTELQFIKWNDKTPTSIIPHMSTPNKTTLIKENPFNAFTQILIQRNQLLGHKLTLNNKIRVCACGHHYGTDKDIRD